MAWEQIFPAEGNPMWYNREEGQVSPFDPTNLQSIWENTPGGIDQKLAAIAASGLGNAGAVQWAQSAGVASPQAIAQSGVAVSVNQAAADNDRGFGGLGGGMSDIAKVGLGSAAFGVGGATGAAAATGNDIGTAAKMDLAGLAAAPGVAAALPATGLSTMVGGAGMSAAAGGSAAGALPDLGAENMFAMESVPNVNTGSILSAGAVGGGTAAGGALGGGAAGGMASGAMSPLAGATTAAAGLGGGSLGGIGTSLVQGAGAGLAASATPGLMQELGYDQMGQAQGGDAPPSGEVGSSPPPMQSPPWMQSLFGGAQNTAGGLAPQGGYQFPYADVLGSVLGLAASQQQGNTLKDVMQMSIDSDLWRPQQSKYFDPLYQAATQGIGNTAYGQSIADSTSRKMAAQGYNMSGNQMHEVAQGLNSGTAQYMGAVGPLAMGKQTDTRPLATLGAGLAGAQGNQYNALGAGLGSILQGQQPGLMAQLGGQQQNKGLIDMFKGMV